MKLPRFQTSTLMLCVAFVAIVCSGLIYLRFYIGNSANHGWALLALSYAALTGPVWTPIAVAAYAVGRRRLTVAIVIFLAVAEVMSFLAVKLIIWIVSVFGQT